MKPAFPKLLSRSREPVLIMPIRPTYSIPVASIPAAAATSHWSGVPWRPQEWKIAAGSIQLTTDGAPHAVGTQDTITIQLNDAGNQPLANAPVKLSVLNGPNAGKSFTGVTDSSGAAVIQYSSTVQGNDLIQAAVNT